MVTASFTLGWFIGIWLFTADLSKYINKVVYELKDIEWEYDEDTEDYYYYDDHFDTIVYIDQDESRLYYYDEEDDEFYYFDREDEKELKGYKYI
jgi:hypothetical protein